MKTYLSKRVRVTIDRPLGSKHPKYDNHIYPLNYGYVEGVEAPDGDYLDAYVIGVYEAIEFYEGVVVGLVERADDVECKLVVAPSIASFSYDQIVALIDFQERFFKSTLYTLDYLQKQLRTTVKCIIKKDDKILTLYEYGEDSPYYHLPGGGMNFEECFETCLRREVKEELEAEVKSFEQVTALNNIFEYKGTIGHEVSIIFNVILKDHMHLINGYEMTKDATPSKVIWLSKEEIMASAVNFLPETMIPYL